MTEEAVVTSCTRDYDATNSRLFIFFWGLCYKNTHEKLMGCKLLLPTTGVEVLGFRVQIHMAQWLCRVLELAQFNFTVTSGKAALQDSTQRDNLTVPLFHLLLMQAAHMTPAGLAVLMQSAPQAPQMLTSASARYVQHNQLWVKRQRWLQVVGNVG
jgi:hypothetical protein